MVSQDPEERVLGRGEAIAIFKSSHGAVIAGCAVREGRFAVGDNFRIITAMGPVYSGKIASLHIEDRSVKEVVKGQQAGVKILDYSKVKVGDPHRMLRGRAGIPVHFLEAERQGHSPGILTGATTRALPHGGGFRAGSVLAEFLGPERGGLDGPHHGAVKSTFFQCHESTDGRASRRGDLIFEFGGMFPGLANHFAQSLERFGGPVGGKPAWEVP